MASIADRIGVMSERDTILAVLQSDIAIAGLVLIFSGFLFSRAAEYDTRYGDKFRWLASAGMVPVLAALAGAWLCIGAIEGGNWAGTHALWGLKIVLALTGAYAVVSALVAFFP
jgi:hypothetical protein